jgi:hypothetical protein
MNWVGRIIKNLIVAELAKNLLYLLQNIQILNISLIIGSVFTQTTFQAMNAQHFRPYKSLAKNLSRETCLRFCATVSSFVVGNKSHSCIRRLHACSFPCVRLPHACVSVHLFRLSVIRVQLRGSVVWKEKYELQNVPVVRKFRAIGSVVGVVLVSTPQRD